MSLLDEQKHFLSLQQYRKTGVLRLERQNGEEGQPEREKREGMITGLAFIIGLF